jgi:hypothetical protein
MTSVTLVGGGSFSPELGSVIVGGYAVTSTAMLSRDGLFARRGFLALVWLPEGLNGFRSLSVSGLALDVAPAADML